MRRHRFDLGAAAIVSTIALTYVLTSQAGWRGLALHIYVVVIGALLLIGFVAEATGEHRRSAFDTALGERSDPHPAIAEVARLEREVTLSP